MTKSTNTASKKTLVSSIAPVAEKPLNTDQAKQFIYMLDRMEAFRRSTLTSAYNIKKKEIEATALPDYTVDQFLKELKTGKIKPAVVSTKGRTVEIGSTHSHVYKNGLHTSEYTAVTKVSMYFESELFIYGKDRIQKLEQLEKDKNAFILAMEEYAASFRIRVRTGAISNNDASKIIDQLMEEWKVPMAVVAQANASNRTCAM